MSFARVRALASTHPFGALFLLLWAPFVAWWLALLPGGLSIDSLNSWEQIVTGRWNNHHPAPFTAFVWLTSLGGTTPATTSLVQTVLMAACLTALVRALVAAGAPQRPVVAAALVLGIAPLLGPFTVILWKDIPETALLLLLAALAIRIVLAPERSRRQLAAVAAAAFGVAILRWNGGLTDVVAAALLCLALPRTRRLWPAAAVALAGVGGFVVLNLIPALTPVAPASHLDSAGQQLADIGQFAAHAPSAFDRYDRSLLLPIADFHQWQLAGRHSCAAINEVTVALIDERHRDQVALAMLPKLESLWRRLALRRPDQLLRAHLCRSNLAWLPFDPPYGRTRILTVWPHVQSNGFGLHPQGIAAVRSAAVSYAEVSDRVVVQDLFWRPVLWVLALLVLAWRFHRRAGHRRMVLAMLAVPLAELASYVVYPAAQDARYCYAAVVLCQLGVVAYVSRLRRDARRPEGQGIG